MTDHNVWTPVHRNTLNKDDKILTTTWAMKKKANGTYCARVNARGYEQVEGLHYDSSSTAAPVTNDTTNPHHLHLGCLGRLESIRRRCSGCLPLMVDSI